jgi:hypothetical protein
VAFYVDAERERDRALAAWRTVIHTFTGSTTPSQRSAAMALAILEYDDSISRIEHHRWPLRAAKDVNRLTLLSREMVLSLEGAATITAGTDAAWGRLIVKRTVALAKANNAVRADLGLPRV